MILRPLGMVITDSFLDREDHAYWVHDLNYTWLADDKPAGLFNSDDSIDLLAAGTYENDFAYGWAEGDFNADGRFASN